MKPKKHTAEGGQHTAAKILDAAEGLLADAGYGGMSMGAVGERAGVPKALVFYHFKSKDQLFEQVLERYYGEHLGALRQSFEAAAGQPLGVRLHGVIDAYFDYISTHQRYPRIIQQQVASGGAADLIRRHFEPLFRWTVDALSTELPATGPLAPRQFFVSFSGLVINYFTYAPVLAGMWGGDPLAVEAVAERRAHVHWFVDRALDGLGPAEVRA